MFVRVCSGLWCLLPSAPEVWRNASAYLSWIAVSCGGRATLCAEISLRNLIFAAFLSNTLTSCSRARLSSIRHSLNLQNLRNERKVTR